MKSFVYHLQINVSNKTKSFAFYKELLGLLGYRVRNEGDDYLGMSNGTTDLWFIQTSENFLKNKYHRKNTGINHLALGVETKTDVDTIFDRFLKPKKIKPLYDSPKEFPEYTTGYYALFFEDPDRIKVEVTYIPGFEKR